LFGDYLDVKERGGTTDFVKGNQVSGTVKLICVDQIGAARLGIEIYDFGGVFITVPWFKSVQKRQEKDFGVGVLTGRTEPASIYRGKALS
jgi:hypothetical protein